MFTTLFRATVGQKQNKEVGSSRGKRFLRFLQMGAASTNS